MSSKQENEPSHKWLIFVTEDGTRPGRHELQWQANGLTIDLVACDLSFAKTILEFIAKTRNNPDFRDIPLGDGRYRQVVTELELDECFVGTKVCFGKDGEYDCQYYMRIGSGNLRFCPVIYDAEVDQLVETLNEIVEDYYVD